jgi:hypothetical protein
MNAYLPLHYIAIIQYCQNTFAIQHVDKEWKLETKYFFNLLLLKLN